MSQQTDLMAYYRQNPIAFLTDILDVKKEHVWGKMEEIAHSVRDNQFSAIKAGNSLSKSFTISRLALWFLYTHYPATVVTTAPSNTQVEEIIWREIASAHSGAKVPLGGTPLRTMLDLQTWKKKEGDKHVKKWFATGFSTRPDTATQQATRFQGFHNENVLIIFDEAAGIDPEIWDAAYKLLTTPSQKLCVIGNPTVSTGDFVNCFKDKSFNKITVSVLDSPNYKAGKEVVPGLSGREFVDGVIAKYGKDSNYYKAMVTGEIPSEDVDSLIPLSLIEQAEERKEIDHLHNEYRKFVVWDVADGGKDLHVIKAYHNTKEVECVELRDKKIEEAEPYVWRLLKKIGGNAIIVDADGVGRVANSYLELSNVGSTYIIPFVGSSTEVEDPDKFKNVRHESHWKMRMMFESGILSIMTIPEQREELAAIKLADSTKGFIEVEPKKLIKKELGRSPNYSDTVMMMCGMYDQIPIIEKKTDRYRNKTFVDDYPFSPETC